MFLALSNRSIWDRKPFAVLRKPTTDKQMKQPQHNPQVSCNNCPSPPSSKPTMVQIYTVAERESWSDFHKKYHSNRHHFSSQNQQLLNRAECFGLHYTMFDDEMYDSHRSPSWIAQVLDFIFDTTQTRELRRRDHNTWFDSDGEEERGWRRRRRRSSRRARIFPHKERRRGNIRYGQEI